MSSSGEGWLNPAAFPICAELQNGFSLILPELQGLIDETIWMQWGTAHYTPTFTKMTSTQIRSMMSSGNSKVGAEAEPTWQLFGLYLRGSPIAENCRRCPNTAAIIAKFPNVVNAGFSCLEAGYRTRPHVGHDPSFYRVHLGLVIPDGDVGITVGGVTKRWRAGETIIFDDTTLHTAWNETPQHRYVLIVDIVNGRRRV